jgi:hypothetical protein
MKSLLAFLLILIFHTSHTFVLGQNRYPGFDVIGKGYNVFGEYANNKSIAHYSLFDFTKMNLKTDGFDHSIPKFIRVDNISDHVVKTIEGSSKRKYISSLSENVGLSGGAFFFKASIESQFTQSAEQTTNFLYYTYMDINTKWRVILDTRNVDTLIKYLDVQFKSDLAKLPPQELFELYGTHFISSAYLGGRIDYSTFSKMTGSISEGEVKTAIMAKFMSIQGNVGMGEYSKRIIEQTKTTTKINVVGGNSEYANNIHNHTQYLKWAEGIKDRPVLSGFDNKSLKPIWLLTVNDARRKELEAYFINSVLPNYPVPKYYTKDPVLDDEDFVQNFTVYFDGFAIHSDCDNYILTGDEAGDFQYSIGVYVNGALKKSYQTKEGYVNRVWSGNKLTVNEQLEISAPIREGSKIQVHISLVESDDLKTENLGRETITHQSPFTTSDLYNYKNENTLWWKERFYNDSDCDATCYYQIRKSRNQTAVDFGNRGWKEFELGNYDQCLYYSKEALKLDNALWYVHYNVALVYLIQGNPRAFEKYKLITNACADSKTARAALLDITNYETEFGALSNSAPIILWLKSKI